MAGAAPGTGLGAFTPASQPSTDFLSLIHLLLSPQPTEANLAASKPPASQARAASPQKSAAQTGPGKRQADSPDASLSQDAIAPGVAPLARPSAQIADAMIRSMLGLPAPAPPASQALAPPAGSAASNKPSSDQAGAPVEPNSNAQLAPAPAPLKSADAPRVFGAAVGNGVFLKMPSGHVATFSAAPKTSSAPIAFALKLTAQAGSQGSAPGADAAHEAESQASTPPVLNAGHEERQPAPVAQPAPVVPAPSAGPEPQGAPEAPKVAAESKPRQDSLTRDNSGQPSPAPASSASAASSGSPIAPGASAGDGGFARQMLNTIAMGPQLAANTAAAPKASAAAGPSASEALRASEPASPQAPALPAAPVREIAVRIATPQSASVDVQLTERAGQIHVAVRTPDSGLQSSLRQDLGSLVNTLERSGYRAEAFAPHQDAPQTISSAQADSRNSQQESESGARGQTAGDSSQNPGAGGQPRQRHPRPQQFIQEMENHV